jgi:ATP-dependent protease ClpP protease subunit
MELELKLEKGHTIASEIELALLNKGEILFIEDVEDGSMKELILKLRYLDIKGFKTIKIFIHSYGGSVDSLNAIINIVDDLKKKGVVVETHVMGVAFSAGSALSVLGTPGKRFCKKLSTFMFHPASYGLDSDYSGNQEAAAKFFSQSNTDLKNMLASNIKFPTEKHKKDFIKNMDKGLWLKAEDALKMGVVDEIN